MPSPLVKRGKWSKQQLETSDLFRNSKPEQENPDGSMDVYPRKGGERGVIIVPPPNDHNTNRVADFNCRLRLDFPWWCGFSRRVIESLLVQVRAQVLRCLKERKRQAVSFFVEGIGGVWLWKFEIPISYWLLKDQGSPQKTMITMIPMMQNMLDQLINDCHDTGWVDIIQ